jgi:hypothetical protein
LCSEFFGLIGSQEKEKKSLLEFVPFLVITSFLLLRNPPPNINLVSNSFFTRKGFYTHNHTHTQRWMFNFLFLGFFRRAFTLEAIFFCASIFGRQLR